MEWVSKDGMTYLDPVSDKDAKITGIRKWDQAFRVYAALYCGANPHRACEIWQYIYVINSAASSLQWDNVAYYDHIFREMMGEHSHMSWSKTYVQLWQLAMRDPFNKPGHSSNIYPINGGGKAGEAASDGKQTNWRDKCCWEFNRTGNCN